MQQRRGGLGLSLGPAQAPVPGWQGAGATVQARSDTVARQRLRP